MVSAFVASSLIACSLLTPLILMTKGVGLTSLAAVCLDNTAEDSRLL